MMARTGADREDHHPDKADLTLQGLLDAIVDPVRRSIVRQLSEQGRDMSCGNFDLPVARSTASHHFNALREAGLIRQYYRGTSHMNALRREDLDEVFPGLLDALLRAPADPS